jgi:hypothetical protein
MLSIASQPAASQLPDHFRVLIPLLSSPSRFNIPRPNNVAKRHFWRNYYNRLVIKPSAPSICFAFWLPGR